MASPRLEQYNNVFTSDQLSFAFSDPAPDGDKIDVIFNGQIVAEDLELTGQPSTVDLPALTTGENELKVTSKNAGTISTSNQVKIDVPTDSNLYGDPSYTFTLMQGESDDIKIGLPKVRIDGIEEAGNQAPFAAQNILDTLDGPTKLTLDRPGSGKRRRAKTKAYTNEFGLIPAGFDRDEVSPAVGVGDNTLPQNVRAIPEPDNARAGIVQRQFINKYGPEGKEIPNGGVIDFYGLPPNYQEGKTGIIPIYGKDGSDDNLIGTKENNDLIYGFGGNDIIEGDDRSRPATIPDGNDTLLGGRGNDSIRGAGGTDILVGQPNDDLLRGDLGNDVVYGGPGNDVLYGDNNNVLSKPLGVTGEDKFVLKGGEGIDLVRDFELGNDIFTLAKPVSFSTIDLRQISNGTRPDGTAFIPTLPDYPSLGSSRGISDNGTEIFFTRGKFKGQTLAYVEDIMATDLDNRGFFEPGNSDSALPEPIA